MNFAKSGVNFHEVIISAICREGVQYFLKDSTSHETFCKHYCQNSEGKPAAPLESIHKIAWKTFRGFKPGRPVDFADGNNGSITFHYSFVTE